MNERGFVTVFALCLILVITLIVKGIQEAETNHNYETTILQAEFDLQNAADGGIYEAAELVRSGQKSLPANNVPHYRKQNQPKLLTTSRKTLHGTISVNVWGERIKIRDCKRQYTPYKSVPIKGNNNKEIIHYGYMLFSVAQLDNERFGKMYRRAFAYVVDGYGTEHYYRLDYSHNGDKAVEPKPEDMIDGTEDESAVFYEDLDKYLVVVKPADKDVVHFMEMP